MSLLSRWIGACDHRTRLAESKADLPEQTLALPYSEAHSVFLFDPRRECLAVPQGHPHAGVTGVTPENTTDTPALSRVEPSRPSRSIPFLQPRQPLLLKTAHPVFHCSRCVAQKMSYLRASHSLGDQQQPMQSMIISRLLGSLNLLLNSEDHIRSVDHGQWSHVSM